MRWGLKSRFHDIDKVMELKPASVEFHLTDEDVEKGDLNGKTYDIDYSIHLPEYWHQEMINPCNLDKLKDNMDIYKKCICKGLALKDSFNSKGKLKVIMHPGGMGIDKIDDLYEKRALYKKLNSFVYYIGLIFGDKIEILLENMPPLPWFYGGQYYSNIFCNPGEIRDNCIIQSKDICLDISHLGLQCNYTNTDIIESIKTIKPFIKQAHIADAKGSDGEGMPIGQGNIDFYSVMKEIKDIDCFGYPEVMWGHQEGYREFKKTIEVCNQYIQEKL